MPLRGIKVVELAGLAPGPFCGMVLADFGASVIRVDRIGAPAMDFLGSGKRSIALNLKSKKGTEVLRRLSDQSDVLLDPYRRGVMEKLRLGPADLMRTNQRLIYARLTGFGQSGPYADTAGHDINFLGLSGLLSLFGRHGSKPTPPANVVADFGGGGLTCALGIVLALFERSRSNAGQVIDASMVDGSAYLGSWLFRSAKSPLWGNPRGRNLLDTGAHFYETYETLDGEYLAVGALEPQFYQTLLEKLGIPEAELPQYENFDENRARLASIFKKRTQAEWLEVFDGCDACVTPVLTLDKVADHPHNRERGTFRTLENGCLSPEPAPRLSRSPAVSVAGRRNPGPGEDTLEVLKELEYQPEEISDLIDERAVEQASRSKI